MTPPGIAWCFAPRIGHPNTHAALSSHQNTLPSCVLDLTVPAPYAILVVVCPTLSYAPSPPGRSPGHLHFASLYLYSSPPRHAACAAPRCAPRPSCCPGSCSTRFQRQIPQLAVACMIRAPYVQDFKCPFSDKLSEKGLGTSTSAQQ